MALLGFISSAADYLKDQLGEDNEDIKEIRDINFDKIKTEFSKKIDSSFNGANNNSDDLIKAGKDVFNNFIKKKESLIEEFDDIFNVDFEMEDDDTTEKHLLNMLDESIDSNSNIDDYARIIANNASGNGEAKVKVKQAQENMDEVFSEIVAHENGSKNKKKDYIGDLLDDLDHSKLAVTIEENKKRAEATRRAVLESIKKMYPYLGNSFIKGVYSLKDSLKEDFSEYEKIVVLHRLHFSELDGLRKFVEVVLQYNYLVNVDEKQMIVDTFKEHENVNGKILTDIFTIANQAKLLTGDYEGYRVLINKQED